MRANICTRFIKSGPNTHTTYRLYVLDQVFRLHCPRGRLVTFRFATQWKATCCLDIPVYKWLLLLITKRVCVIGKVGHSVLYKGRRVEFVIVISDSLHGKYEQLYNYRLSMLFQVTGGLIGHISLVFLDVAGHLVAARVEDTLCVYIYVDSNNFRMKWPLT